MITDMKFQSLIERIMHGCRAATSAGIAVGLSVALPVFRA
jgi:hypothetical protein